MHVVFSKSKTILLLPGNTVASACDSGETALSGDVTAAAGATVVAETVTAEDATENIIFTVFYLISQWQQL